jgi:hypothetical protein
MNNMTTSCLNLNIDGETLFQLDETNVQITGLKDVESVSLAKGLLGHETELDIKNKTCLAVVLSYSLLDFCWELWFPGGWTKDGISLLQYSGQLQLRPALVTYIYQRPKGYNSFKVSNDLKLLFHGILLMEIFKQEALPFQMNLKDVTNINEIRLKARIEFSKVRWGVSERFRQSVEACIEGFEGGRLDSSEDTDESFATEFYKTVINLLERDFVSLWGDEDPDCVLSKLKLSNIKHKKRPPLPPKPKPDHLKVIFHILKFM